MSKKVTLLVVGFILAASLMACQLTGLFPTPTTTRKTPTQVPAHPVEATTYQQ